MKKTVSSKVDGNNSFNNDRHKIYGEVRKAGILVVSDPAFYYFPMNHRI